MKLSGSNDLAQRKCSVLLSANVRPLSPTYLPTSVAFLLPASTCSRHSMHSPTYTRLLTQQPDFPFPVNSVHTGHKDQWQVLVDDPDKPWKIRASGMPDCSTSFTLYPDTSTSFCSAFMRSFRSTQFIVFGTCNMVLNSIPLTLLCDCVEPPLSLSPMTLTHFLPYFLA